MTVCFRRICSNADFTSCPLTKMYQYGQMMTMTEAYVCIKFA